MILIFLLQITQLILKYLFLLINLNKKPQHSTKTKRKGMKVLVTGRNSFGQLQQIKPIAPYPSLTISKDPYLKEGLIGKLFEMEDLNFKIKKIACGHYHVLILTENNELYGCGRNYEGQLGLGVVTGSKVISNLTKINISHLDSEIKEINCGGFYSTILTKDNGFYLTGQGDCGQLGFGNSNQLDKFTKNNFNFKIIKTVKCCGTRTIVLNEDGDFYFSGTNLQNSGYVYNFEKFYCNPNIADFYCGVIHAIMLDKCGKLFKLTPIGVTEITISPLIGNIIQIGCSYHHCYFLSDKNKLYINEYQSTTKISLVDFESYYKNIKIHKLYSGLSHYFYFTSENGEKLYFIDERRKEVVEMVNDCKEKERYLYPIIGNDFVYIINSNNPNLFTEDSKEVERMMQLLFKQQCCDSYFNNSFRDISFLFE